MFFKVLWCVKITVYCTCFDIKIAAATCKHFKNNYFKNKKKSQTFIEGTKFVIYQNDFDLNLSLPIGNLQ